MGTGLRVGAGGAVRIAGVVAAAVVAGGCDLLGLYCGTGGPPDCPFSYEQKPSADETTMELTLATRFEGVRAVVVLFEGASAKRVPLVVLAEGAAIESLDRRSIGELEPEAILSLPTDPAFEIRHLMPRPEEDDDAVVHLQVQFGDGRRTTYEVGPANRWMGFLDCPARLDGSLRPDHYDEEVRPGRGDESAIPDEPCEGEPAEV